MADPHALDVRPLPEDRAEFDKLIAPYSVLVNPLMVGFSECLGLVGSEKLSKQEIDGGTQAFSALFAQYFPGKFTDSRFLVFMWVLGTLMPRLMRWIQERQKRKSAVPPGQLSLESANEAKALELQAGAVGA